MAWMLAFAWYMQRSSYRWGEVNGLDIQSLTVRMERQREEYRRTAFSDSYSGRKHFPDSSYDWKDITLTVHEGGATGVAGACIP